MTHRFNAHMFARGVSVLFALGCAPALAAGPAHDCTASDGTRHFYSYFKEAIPLGLDTTRVAVLQASSADAGSLRTSLAPMGIPVEGITPWEISGWSMASVPSQSRQEESLRSLVDRLAAASALGFVSPVYLDEYGPVVVTPVLLVGFNDETSPDRARTVLLEAHAGTIADVDFARMKNVYRVRSGSRNGFEVLKIANALARHADVKFAEPDMIRTAKLFDVPNDFFFSRQWALHNTGQNPFLGMSELCCSVPCPGDCWPECPELCLSAGLGYACNDFPGGLGDFDIDAPEAWEITTGNPSIITAVFDCGIQLDHPDLMIEPALGWDFTGEGTGGYPNYARPCDGHGTMVAGLLRGQINNTIGIAGVAPTARTASARVLRSTSTTNPCGNSALWAHTDLVVALDTMQSNGVRITNHSYGINQSAILTEKFALTRAAGMIHFAGTGNCGCQSVSYPAFLPSVLAVSGTEHTGVIWPVSSFGAAVDFSAPAAWHCTTDVTGDYYLGGFGPAVCNDYTFAAGTSFAGPTAAGVAALVLSVDDSLDPGGVEAIMRLSALDLGAPGRDIYYGWGMVNAYAAVTLAQVCRSDLDRSGDVDLTDLTNLLSNYGRSNDPGREEGDIDADGAVTLSDLTLLLSAFGTVCS